MKYYRLDNILTKDALYNIIFGERSNGKSFAVLEYCIKSNKQFGIIRRWQEDFKGKRGENMFTGIVAAGVIKKVTKGNWESIAKVGDEFFFTKYDKDLSKNVRSENPIGFCFSLNSTEHYKSLNFNGIKTLFFDEFMTRDFYQEDEFERFMSIVSTVVRDRDDVKIFMAGNTVSKYCPHLINMGIDINKMTPGDIDVYTYGDNKCTVAVEYTASTNGGKRSDHYFNAFDNNPRLKMITDGSFEFDLYPHLPHKYDNDKVIRRFFIKFNNDLIELDYINDGSPWIYAHRKTTPIKHSSDIVFSSDPDTSRFHFTNIKQCKKLLWFFENSRVFYQDNSVGESVRVYFQKCGLDL